MGFIKNFKRRSLSWTLQVGSNSNDKCPHKTEAKGDLTNREVMWRRRPRSGRSSHKLRIAGRQQTLAKVKEQNLPRGLRRERGPADNLTLAKWDPIQTFDLQNWGIINLCCVSHVCYSSNKKLRHQPTRKLQIWKDSLSRPNGLQILTQP